jgi:hypothetical protein
MTMTKDLPDANPAVHGRVSSVGQGCAAWGADPGALAQPADADTLERGHGPGDSDLW